MMKSAMLCRSAVGAALLICPSLAGAASTFEFRTDLANYNLLPTQTVSVPLYFTETKTGAAFFLDLEAGLSAAGILINRVPNTNPTPAPVSPAFISHLSSNSAFNDPVLIPLITVTPSQATLLEFAPAGIQGALPFLVDASTEAVPIGLLSITAGPDLGDVTTFHIADLSAGADTLSFAHALQVDPTTVASFTVTVVPEPASAVLLLAGTTLLLRRPRR